MPPAHMHNNPKSVATLAPVHFHVNSFVWFLLQQFTTEMIAVVNGLVMTDNL